MTNRSYEAEVVRSSHGDPARWSSEYTVHITGDGYAAIHGHPPAEPGTDAPRDFAAERRALAEAYVFGGLPLEVYAARMSLLEVEELAALLEANAVLIAELHASGSLPPARPRRKWLVTDGGGAVATTGAEGVRP